MTLKRSVDSWRAPHKPMMFNEYQTESRRTAVYPDAGNNFIYPVLGLTGEAGEVAEKVKKLLRDKNSVMDEETRALIAKELGDVLWYIAQIATELGLSLDDIASMNLEKLLSRLERGVIYGNGDTR
jgi:NTP pyrophosphatase (non-canonical NTP hydrolase)